jgi:NAD(P)-dependent dehydrogenase (short-subunit alcohol dehydrogenase family)
MDHGYRAAFVGRIAIVTGAAQGIGEATARLLAARGAEGLLLTDCNAERGVAVASSLQEITPTKFITADLADTDQLARIVPAAEQAFGRVDVLVNVAGMSNRSTIWNTSIAQWDRMFAVNVRAPFLLMQAALHSMDRQEVEGTIVNIISVNAHGGPASLTPYSASKGALATLTKNVANAVVRHRIRVNGLNLGWVDTPGEHAVLKRDEGAQDDWLDDAERRSPFGRLMKPEDVARAVAFLASAESGLMTGAVIDFDQMVVGANGGAPDRSPPLAKMTEISK